MGASGIYWLLVLAWKFFAREPLLFLYSAEGYTQETVAVAAALAVQLVALGYQLLTRTALGRAADSMVLLSLSPKIAVASSLVFLMWADSKPAPGASYAPLAALTVLSIVGSIVVRWGPMSRDYRRSSAAVAAPGKLSADYAPVVRVSKPLRTFADIHGNRQVKERLPLARSCCNDVPYRKTNGCMHSEYSALTTKSPWRLGKCSLLR